MELAVTWRRVRPVLPFASRGTVSQRRDTADFVRGRKKEEQLSDGHVEMAVSKQRNHGRVSTLGPVSVTAMVCSQCEEIFPSRVTTVQPSGSTSTSCVPKLIIGSMARTIPGRKRGFGCPRVQSAGP